MLKLKERREKWWFNYLLSRIEGFFDIAVERRERFKEVLQSVVLFFCDVYFVCKKEERKIVKY